MRKGILSSVGCALLSATFAVAQETPLPDVPGEPVPIVIPESSGSYDTGAGGRFWLGGDYLLWWVKDGPMPVPLLSVGDTTNRARLDQPGTRVVFGGADVDFGTFSGGRLTGGAWGEAMIVGFEGSGFLLEQRSVGAALAPTASGLPVTGLPILDATTNTEETIVGQAPAGVFPFTSRATLAVDAQTRLWGAEANGLLNLVRNDRFQLDAIAGFRYLDLDENLTISLGGATALSGGQTIVVGAADQFNTRNQFYGGQLGGRLAYRYNRLSLGGTAKVALGSVDEVVAISGSRSQVGFGGAASFTSPGFVYALPTNIGRTTRNHFAVLPEVQGSIGYHITERVRASVGYTFLYLSDVVRPGDQVDRVINESQRLGAPLVGPARPMPLFNTTDFWAQGVSFGLEFTY